MPDIQTQLAPLTSDDFRQDQTRVCTIMAFLIGVDWQKCSFYYEQEEQLYEELQKNQECVIIIDTAPIFTYLSKYGFILSNSPFSSSPL